MLGHWRLVGIGSIWDGRMTLAQDVLGFIGQDTTDDWVCFTIPRYPNAQVVFEEGMEALDSLGATMTATKPQVSATTSGKEPRKMPNKVWQGVAGLPRVSQRAPTPQSPSFRVLASIPTLGSLSLAVEATGRPPCHHLKIEEFWRAQ